MNEQTNEKRKSQRTEGAPEDIHMTPVDSSNIRAVGYDGEEEVLYVTFTSRATYAYLDVPYKRAMAMLAAPSKGIFFHDYIKDKYETVKAPALLKKGAIKKKKK